MWLVLDIGNTAAKGGLFDGPALKRTFRLDLLPRASEAVWEEALRPVLKGLAVERVGLASVVPAATAVAQAALRQQPGLEAEVIHHAMHLPFSLTYQTPRTLGTDRLAAAAGAWHLHGASAGAPRAVVALDAGTAVTCEVIDRDGRYRGGSIGAGPELVRRALRQGTAQLPEVPLVLPPGPVGRSTEEALQAGILYGLLDSVQGMLARIARALDEEPLVVATGGWSPLLHRHLDAIDRVEPHLVLHGIRVLMALNAKEKQERRRPA